MATKEQIEKEIAAQRGVAKDRKAEAEYFEMYEPDNKAEIDRCYREVAEADQKAGELEHELRYGSCRRCGEFKPDEVRERYSFGITAGRLCIPCCKTYRDHCGIDQAQGRVEELDEFAFGGYPAIDGD